MQAVNSRVPEVLIWFQRRKWRSFIGSDHIFSDFGTALGDWTADSTGLGYEGCSLVFCAGLVLLSGLYYWTTVSRVFLFWAAFILTRPLGATVGDFLD
jgi:uncharacterized membrane-anchored protein